MFILTIFVNDEQTNAQTFRCFSTTGNYVGCLTTQNTVVFVKAFPVYLNRLGDLGNKVNTADRKTAIKSRRDSTTKTKQPAYPVRDRQHSKWALRWLRHYVNEKA